MTYVWMRHPSFPAGQAALIPSDSVAFWSSRGWAITTADTLGTVAAPPITYVTLTHASLGGRAIQVPSTAVSGWTTRGWA